MGVAWIPGEEILALDTIGATERVCKKLLRWSYKLSTAIASHTNDEDTREATRRSGGNTGRSGLTAEEAQLRADKKGHIGNYQYSQSLHQEILNEKAARKGHNKGYGEGAKSTKSKGQKAKGKRRIFEMSDDEKWWLGEFWSGRLRHLKDQAASKCRRIEASSFTISE